MPISDWSSDVCSSDLPTPAGSIRTPPTVSFTVETAKFSGRVSVIYLRADDAYAVALHRDDEQVERRDDVYFDMLGETLVDLIDDGTWRRIRVHTLQKPARRDRKSTRLNSSH